MENRIIYKCDKCSKTYKNKQSLDKHILKCKVVSSTTEEGNVSKDNNYDVNMTFLEGNKLQVEVTKHNDDGTEESEKVLKDILKPTVSESYQDEIDKLEDLIKMFKDFPIPETSENKDATIEKLKNIISIIMSQSKNLIKEMQSMSKRNSYYKNNIMLAAFVLDKCRKDVPEDEDDLDNIFD